MEHEGEIEYVKWLSIWCAYVFPDWNETPDRERYDIGTIKDKQNMNFRISILVLYLKIPSFPTLWAFIKTIQINHGRDNDEYAGR